MIQRVKRDWPALIKAWKVSGLSQAAFCRQHRMSAKHFSLRKRALTDLDLSQSSSSDFIRLVPTVLPTQALSTHNQPIRLRYAAIELCLDPVTVSPDWLAQLLKELS